MAATTAQDPDLDLAALDAHRRAGDPQGRAEGLRVLGYGEVTLVVGWPTARPELAVKRLPLFRDERPARPLRARSSSVRGGAARARRAGGADRRAARHGRERRSASRLSGAAARAGRAACSTSCCATADAGAAARALLDTLAAMVAESVDARVGLDAQAANWAVDGDAARDCVDVSTPLMRVAGRPRPARPRRSSCPSTRGRCAPALARDRPRRDGAVPRRRAPCSSTWPRT